MDGRICTVLLISLALAHAKVFKFDQSEGLPELENGGKHWAILVAGSNQFINYRHQVRSRRRINFTETATMETQKFSNKGNIFLRAKFMQKLDLDSFCVAD